MVHVANRRCRYQCDAIMLVLHCSNPDTDVSLLGSDVKCWMGHGYVLRWKSVRLPLACARERCMRYSICRMLGISFWWPWMHIGRIVVHGLVCNTLVVCKSTRRGTLDSFWSCFRLLDTFSVSFGGVYWLVDGSRNCKIPAM